MPAARPLRLVGRRRIGARRHSRPRQGVATARRPRRDHRQEDRRSRHARDHEHLREVPTADDGRDPVVGHETAVAVTGELRYGAFAPQGWKLEYSGWSAADAW